MQQAATWFARRKSGEFLPERTPVAMRDGDPAFSCCPSPEGTKIVPRDQVRDELGTPAESPRAVSAEVAQHAAAALTETVPGLDPDPIRTSTYPEAYTPDGRPLLGPPAEGSAVVIAAGGSGHSFQLAPTLGTISADLALTGTTDHEIDFMAPTREYPTQAG